MRSNRENLRERVMEGSGMNSAIRPTALCGWIWGNSCKLGLIRAPHIPGLGLGLAGLIIPMLSVG